MVLNEGLKRSARLQTMIASLTIHFILQHSASSNFAEEDGKWRKNISGQRSRSRGTPWSDDSLNNVSKRAKGIDFCRGGHLNLEFPTGWRCRGLVADDHRLRNE